MAFNFLRILPVAMILLFAEFSGAASKVSVTPVVEPVFLDSLSHSESHFTQGLFFDGKDLVETTGQYGGSGLYRYNNKGIILDSSRLSERFFGEGSIAVGEDIFYLTWKSKRAFIYNRKSFQPKGEFPIPTEGWGLTFWNNALLMSNGSHELLQIALGSYSVFGAIQVTDNGRPVKKLNELEVVGNTLYANIWYSDSIAVIELPSGKVKGYIDFSKKVQELRTKYPRMDVLNGIAFDGRDFWVTGKNWPKLYKVKFNLD